MDRYNQLFQEIFNRPLNGEANVGLLEKTIADYPYFTPAHFFLLHLTDRSAPAYAEQAKKTALSFNNNYWLNFQLLQLNQEVNNYSPAAKAEIEVSGEGQNPGILPTEYQSPAEEELVENGKEPVPVAMAEISPSPDTALVIEGNSSDDLNAATTIPEPQADAYFFADAITVDAPVVESGELEVLEVAADNLNQLTGVPVEIEEHSEQISSADINISTEAIDTGIETGLNPNEVIEPVGDHLNEHIENTTAHSNEEPQYSDAEIDAHETLQNQTDNPEHGDTEPDAEMEQVSLKMAETLAAITLEKNTNEDTVSFEPLHASDYFASVGIKLSEEIKPADRLGIQLKSFTEWLKTMKKVHAEQLADTTTSEVFQEKNDQTIQALAEASNKANEVLTEAMADVFQQQGKINKAVEVYEKLSLLDPSKRVYFAAKINQLKD